MRGYFKIFLKQKKKKKKEREGKGIVKKGDDKTCTTLYLFNYFSPT